MFERQRALVQQLQPRLGPFHRTYGVVLHVSHMNHLRNEWRMIPRRRALSQHHSASAVVDRYRQQCCRFHNAMSRLVKQFLTLALCVVLGEAALAQSSKAVVGLPPPFVALGTLAQVMASDGHELILPPPFAEALAEAELEKQQRPPNSCDMGGGQYVANSALECGSLRFENVARVWFVHDDVALDDSAQRELARLAQRLRTESELSRILIRGHADEVGLAAYNDSLSDQRALAVRDYLAALGIAPELLYLQGHGEHAPQDENWTRLGRARNRWVEVYTVHVIPAGP